MDRRSHHAARPRWAIVAIGGLVAALAPVTPALAADPITVVFTATGAEESWVVPDGVSSIHAVLVGGRGGDAGSASGLGHAVTGDLDVAAGTTIYIEVGGNGAGSIGQAGAAGGFNGGAAGGPGTQNAGAGGGGASDIRTVSRSSAGTLESRLIVAAGGGGRGGTDNVGLDPSAGGSAGSDGTAGGAPGTPGLGGAAGTSLAGGAGGAGVSGGAAGALGIGGAGSDGGVQGNGGGGGGGGYYGGGGGGGGSLLGGGGGGGGGSSFTGSASGAFVSADSSGTPSITITYTVGPGPTPPPPGEGVVDAVIAMVDATVCIELSTSSVDFGTEQFGEVGIVATPEIEVMNCSDASLRLYARGSNATGPGASWTLVKNGATCADTLGLDNYHLGLHENQAVVDWQLGTTNTELEDIAAGSPGSFSATIDTACPGSTGAGQQMSMQITFVATEATP